MLISVLVCVHAYKDRPHKIMKIRNNSHFLVFLEQVIFIDFVLQVVSSFFDFPIVVHIYEESEETFDMSSVDTMMSGPVSCSISPNDKMAALSSTDGAVRVIDMAGSYKLRLQQKSSAVALIFSKDSKELLSTGYRSIYVWSLTEGICRWVLMKITNDIKVFKCSV